MSWQTQYSEGQLAAKETPWISLSGKPDAFRQGFYDVTSEILAKRGYTHVVSAEVYREITDLWVKSEFRTTKDALNHHLARLKERGARNITSRELQ